MNITLIWAQGHNRAIGRDNTMPWHLPEDFAHFRNITKGKPVLMGRKTWDSLPKKPLPGRTNLVLSRTAGALPGAHVFSTVDEALSFCAQSEYAELVVIGGSQIYEDFLTRADSVWVTHVDQCVPDADAYAPKLLANEWRVVLEHDLCSVPVAYAALYTRASKTEKFEESTSNE